MLELQLGGGISFDANDADVQGIELVGLLIHLGTQ